MEPLDLLWELEDQWEVLDSYKKELLDLKNGSGVKQLKKKKAGLEKNLKSTQLKEEKIKEKLTDNEKKLNINNFNMGELDKSLYDGHTTDIKQLEHLSNEKEKIQNKINDSETKVLEFMVNLEELNKEAKTIEEELKNIDNDNDELIANSESLLNNLNSEIDNMGKKIEALEEKIDEDLLTEYNRVKESRGSGIAELKDSICLGCNIKISTLAEERIRNTKEIFHCESCGRMLYHKEAIS